jgi:hypothetical protein
MKNVLPSLMVLLHSQLWKVFFFLTLSCIFRLINSQLDKPAPLAILPIYSLRFVVIRNSLVMTAHWHVHSTTTTGHKTHSKAYLKHTINMSIVSQSFAFKSTSIHIVLVNIPHLFKYITPFPLWFPILTKPLLYPSSNSKGAFQRGTSRLSSRCLGY